MIASKHITKIVAVIMAIAVCLCLCAMAFSDKLVELAGGTGVTMEYESALFDTSEPLQVNIVMDETEWDTMLANATAEEYYQCDVEIGGETFYQVGIRPKGNTSLSSIASDPDTDRYSFKLEFDQYVDGQTCFGLDKLILNNNYADATNMKEALIYDMYQFLGADASLYNYAEISVNGEYWGVYLALEAVEDSFLLRNYGTEDGELYKPDSMEFGGQGGGMEMPDRSDMGGMDFGANQYPSVDGAADASGADEAGEQMPDMGGMTPPDASGETGTNRVPDEAGDSMQQMRPGSGTTGNSFSQMGDVFADLDLEALAAVLEEAGYTVLAEALESSDFADIITAMADIDTDALVKVLKDAGYADLAELLGSMDLSQIPGNMGDMQMPEGSDIGGGRGGFSMSGSGANLNYSDDDLDSYSTIWDGAVSNTSESDHERVVTALKNISEGTDLEEYMDIDNLLKYMAVHVFSVNADSLSGSMAHNYYLYEYNGVLNLLPWDYNLALGGMGGMGRGGGSSSNATSIVNDAIDNAFSSTNFFDTLMENEEYKAQYYAYLQQLVDEYLLGDGLETFYTRTRSQIDSLVETDPTAFYSYDEYVTAVETLYEVAKLRGESIQGQINGTIPSTATEQNNSDALIDASHLDVSVMGSMNMSGGMDFGNSNRGNRSGRSGESGNEAETPAKEDTEPEVSGTAITGSGAAIFDLTAADNGGSGGTEQPGGQMPEGFDPSQSGGNMPEGFDPSQAAGQMPGGMNGMPSEDGTQDGAQSDDSSSEQQAGDAFGGFPGQTGGNSGNMPGMDFSGGETTGSNMSNLILYGICFILLLAALLFAKLYRRKPRRR